MNLLPHKPWWPFTLTNYPRERLWVPVHIFKSQGTKAIIERCKEQVQGNLVVVGVEMGGKWKKKKTWQKSQLIYLAVFMAISRHKKNWTVTALYMCTGNSVSLMFLHKCCTHFLPAFSERSESKRKVLKC